MDSIVEENGNSSNNINDTNTSGAVGGLIQQHPSQQQQPALQQTQQQQINITNSNNSQNLASQNQISVPASVAAVVAAGTVLTTTSTVVQYLSNNPHGMPVQSVIQAASQSSVIQTAAGNNTQSPVAIPKGVLFVNKPNTTVIHTTSGNAVQIPPHFQCKIKPEPNTHHLDTNSEDSFTDDDSPRGRRELTRRPSYNKIYSEISGPDITGGANMQMSENVGLPPLAPSTAVPTTGSLIHLPPDNTSAFYLPNRMPYNPNNNVIAEDQTRKREIRLQKNREAARECRRKKKEYIKCLENRVAVLENQNKALIEELKSLKELYCQTKNDWDKPPGLEHETIVKVIKEDDNAKDMVNVVVTKKQPIDGNIKLEHKEFAQEDATTNEEDEEVEEEQKFFVIKPNTSAAAHSSVITLGNDHRFLDVRKSSLLLRKALVEDQKQEVVIVCATSPAAASCIRPTTSAANVCEPD